MSPSTSGDLSTDMNLVLQGTPGHLPMQFWRTVRALWKVMKL
jgi:hypothetical protein